MPSAGTSLVLDTSVVASGVLESVWREVPSVPVVVSGVCGVVGAAGVVQVLYQSQSFEKTELHSSVYGLNHDPNKALQKKKK